MKLFNFNSEYSIICEWKKTRNGFKHEATLLRNGREQETAKCCYLNRTWERYTYATVIHNLLSKCDLLSAEQKEAFRAQVDKAWAYS